MSTSRKLSVEQVIDIYIRNGRGESYKVIAEEFNITKGMACQIGTGQRWDSVTDLIDDEYFDNYIPLKERTS